MTVASATGDAVVDARSRAEAEGGIAHAAAWAIGTPTNPGPANDREVTRRTRRIIVRPLSRIRGDDRSHSPPLSRRVMLVAAPCVRPGAQLRSARRVNSSHRRGTAIVSHANGSLARMAHLYSGQ